MAILLRITEYLRGLMKQSPEIARQFLPINLGLEQQVEVARPFEGVRKTGIPGTERMYGSEMVVLATTDCAAECGFCFRRDYLGKPEEFNLKDLDKLEDYIIDQNIREVLITGGEPLIEPYKTSSIAISLLINTALRKIRIGTSMLRSDPERVTQEWINELGMRNSNRKFEIAHHFNHPAEFSGEALNKIRQLDKAGIGQYVQTVLLKGVNDNPETMKNLANKIRDSGMEWHYLLHCMPVTGNLYFRTSVKKGIDLIEDFEAHRETTGRHPPKRYVVASPIGKIYVDNSRIAGKENCDGKRYLWLESRYKPEDFKDVTLPDICRVGKRGFLEVKYLDGKD